MFNNMKLDINCDAIEYYPNIQNYIADKMY